jgi:hypothetical protein
MQYRTFARELIHDDQRAEVAAIFKTIGDEIHTPSFVGACG